MSALLICPPCRRSIDRRPLAPWPARACPSVSPRWRRLYSSLRTLYRSDLVCSNSLPNKGARMPPRLAPSHPGGLPQERGGSNQLPSHVGLRSSRYNQRYATDKLALQGLTYL